MDDATPPQPPAEQQDDLLLEEELEYKPEVKMAAAALLLLAWVGVCFVFYRLGRQSGYEEGLNSDQVAKRVNTEAVNYITYFMQIASADDQVLLDKVLHHSEKLAWVADPEIRRETLGMLLCVLMDRGLILQAEPVLEEILPLQPPSAPEWTARMQKAARCLAMAGKWEKAQAYFKCAESAYRTQGKNDAWQEALQERAALLVAGCGGDTATRRAELEAILAEQQEHAADAAELSAELHVLLGRVLREQGEKEAAEKHFRAALAISIPGEAPSTIATICQGAAHLELNEREAAEQKLKSVLEQRESSTSHALPLYLAMGLRDLATLTLNETQARETLTYLDAAKTLATPYMPTDSLFWPALAEQHAWALFVARDYNESLVEFHHVLQSISNRDEKLRVRPLEGIARCCLALGRVEEALPTAEECAMLRERLFPEAKESLGRVYLLLGQACDQASLEARAAEAYGRAAATLPEGHGGKAMAFVSQAYSLSQAQQWEAAAKAWEAALPLLPQDDTAFRERVETQLADCRKKAAAAKAPARPRTGKPKPTRRNRR